MNNNDLQPNDIHQPDLNKANVIRWLGENIFPQPIKVALEKWGDAVVELAEQGYIVKSTSRIGRDATMMKQPKAYVELSDKGWEWYDKLKKEKAIV